MKNNITVWESFLQSLPLVDEAPTESFILPSAFAKLSGANQTSVRVALTSGTINAKCCVTTLMRNGNLRALIDWNAAGHDYIASRAKKYWPKGFKPNKAKKYKPIKVTKTSKLSAAPKTVDKPKGVENIVTIQEAKLEHEKIKILEAQVANQIANNEALLVEKVMQISQSLAFAVKSQLRRYITLSSSQLLRCKTVVEVRAIQEKYMQDVLAELEPMTVETTYTGEDKKEGNK